MVKRIYDCTKDEIIEIPLTEKEINEKQQAESDHNQKQIKHNILKELQTLDMEIPRIVEDIIEQGNFIIHQSKIDKINRKKELRLELQSIT